MIFVLYFNKEFYIVTDYMYGYLSVVATFECGSCHNNRHGNGQWRAIQISCVILRLSPFIFVGREIEKFDELSCIARFRNDS